MVMKGIRFGNPSELKLPGDMLKSVESPYPNETSKRNSSVFTVQEWYQRLKVPKLST